MEHGIDVSLRNHEGQTALDLATAEDVRILLKAAMPKTRDRNVVKMKSEIKTHDDKKRLSIAGSEDMHTDLKSLSDDTTQKTSDNFKTQESPEAEVLVYSKSISCESGDGCMDLDNEQTKNRTSADNMEIRELLQRIDETYVGLYLACFEREKINMEILAEMSNEQLKEIGIDAYGARHKIIKGIEKFYKESRFLHFELA